MKKNVIVFGLIAGLIVTSFMAYTLFRVSETKDFDMGMVYGYTAMLVAFSFVFVGIKNYRDKYNGGVITFGQAFKTGFFITLIASTIYVMTWMIEYQYFFPDFMDKYSEHVIKELKESGASTAEVDKQVAEMASMKEWYKNPLFRILITYAEILPIGLLITLISAWILKRKAKQPDAAVA